MSALGRFFPVCIALCVLLTPRCGPTGSLASGDGGSGTQTTNGICVAKKDNLLSGYAFQIGPDSSQKVLHGKTAITLRLLSSDFQPYDSKGYDRIVPLDSTGIFVFDSLKNGYYNLMATDTLDSGSLIFQALPVFDSTGAYARENVFSAPGEIGGTITDSSLVSSPYRGVFVSGTPFFSLADSAGAFRLSGVPAGSYVLKADYFSITRAQGYTRIKGTLSGKDSLTIYTDSIQVIVSPDSVSRSSNLSL